jgi:gliding motility-associated-like protein
MHPCMAQVITAPPLQCVVPLGTTNTLTWGLAANNPCGTFISYQIFVSDSQYGTYALDTTIFSQTATTWVAHEPNNSSWYYYVKDSFNCPGATYQTSDTIKNEANPQVPVLTLVTVNPDSTITLTWQPSTSPQTTFYVIYRITPNGNKINVDTVIGRFTTTWIDSTENPYASSLEYSVAAGDSCAANQLSSYNINPLQTILLNYSQAHCSLSIPLAWTKYNFLPGGLGGYEIYVSRNDSAYQLVTRVDSATLSYAYTNFSNGDSLQIYVVAVGAADTTVKASSEYIRFVASEIQPPSYIYITNLSVDTGNNQIDISWIVDNTAKVRTYQVYNSVDTPNWQTIPDANNGVEQVPVPMARFASYIDSTVQPQFGPYAYRVQADDSCGHSINSPMGEIVSLQGTLSDYYQITLTWNPFALYGATVVRYDLYRDVGTGMVFDKSFSPNTTTCIDSVFQYIDLPGQFCYLIRATYILSLPSASFDSTLISFSNITCVDHRPIIYIPNAFVWNGVNNFFKPKIIFGEPAGYSMTIWDRYGGKIFETHDPNISWDGTNGGKPVDQGGYAYLIQFTALDGTPVSRDGIVMFIKK